MFCDHKIASKTALAILKTISRTYTVLHDVNDLPDESLLTVGIEGKVVGKEGEHAGRRVVSREEEDDSLGDHEVFRQTYSRNTILVTIRSSSVALSLPQPTARRTRRGQGR